MAAFLYVLVCYLQWTYLQAFVGIPFRSLASDDLRYDFLVRGSEISRSMRFAKKNSNDMFIDEWIYRWHHGLTFNWLRKAYSSDMICFINWSSHISSHSCETSIFSYIFLVQPGWKLHFLPDISRVNSQRTRIYTGSTPQHRTSDARARQVSLGERGPGGEGREASARFDVAT